MPEASPSKSTLGSARWFRVKNESGEAIPVGAVVWIDGLTTDDDDVQVLSAAKPDADNDQHSFFIAVHCIGEDDCGTVTNEAFWAAYDTGGAAPSRDDEIGPTDGDWYLVAGGTGFKCLSDGEDGFVFVVPSGRGEPGPPGTGAAGIYRFEAQTDLVPGGSCDAKLVSYSGSYSSGGGTFQVKDFTSPGSWRASLPAPGADGKPQGLCYFPSDGPTRTFDAESAEADGSETEITATGHGLITGQQVTITGGTGTDLDGVNGTWTVTVTGDDTFTLDGSTFAGTYDEDSASVEVGLAEIIWMEMLAEEIEATLAADLSAGSASAAVQHHRRGLDPGTTVVVHDKNGRWPNLKSGQKVTASYSVEDDEYHIVTPSIEVTVLADFRVDEESQKLQVKYADLVVQSALVDETWTDAHEGTNC